MNLEEEYDKNRLSVRRCKRIYNYIAIFYIVIYGLLTFDSLYLSLLSFSFPELSGAVLHGCTLAAGYIGVYKQNNFFAAVAPALSILSLPFDLLNKFFVPVCVVCTVLNILANKKYHWLEQQDGFPYFNTRFRDQLIDTSQWNIKDPYTQKYEEIKKKENNNGQMDEL